MMTVYRSASEMTEILDKELGPKGLEAHSFLVGWYNEKVNDKFKLQYSDDTLAFVIVSTPDMFEQAVLPFIKLQCSDPKLDPVDSCIKHEMQSLRQKFESRLEFLHDFELDHNRRPRILVQTAGHVSGAAYFYQRSDVREQSWEASRTIYGVSIHPQYGGWFALRCALIFEDVKCPELPRKEPEDVVSENEKRVQLLEQFTDNWQNWQYRDIIPVRKRYSQRQQDYFATLPRDRRKLLRKWKEEEG